MKVLLVVVWAAFAATVAANVALWHSALAVECRCVVCRVIP